MLVLGQVQRLEVSPDPFYMRIEWGKKVRNLGGRTRFGGDYYFGHFLFDPRPFPCRNLHIPLKDDNDSSSGTAQSGQGLWTVRFWIDIPDCGTAAERFWAKYLGVWSSCLHDVK